MTLFLALRNLFLQRKRYTLIGTAVILGFTLMTVLTGTAYGAMETVMIKAARYFSGHVSVSGYLRRDKVIEDPDTLIRDIMDSGLPVNFASRRTIYAGREARLFFGGNSVRLRRQIGVDFEKEKDVLSNLPFIEGGVEGMTGKDGKNGIIISLAASRLLGARLGDDISLYLTTDEGRHNTGTMVVKGIFDETSIFGYATYMHNTDLNRLLERRANAATDIAVYAEEGANIVRLTRDLHRVLGEKYPVFPPIPARDDFPSRSRRDTEVETLAVMSLNAHLAQIKDLLDAFVIGAYFVFAVFMVIVMVGVLNTYRVMIYERTREIGTMRALGMQRSGVRRLFLYEALGLALIASLLGFILGTGLLELAGAVDLGGIAAADMFTESGRLNYYLNPLIMTVNTLVMVSAVLLAALGPAHKASRMTPAQAIVREA